MEITTMPFPWVRLDNDLNIICSNEKFSETFLNDKHEIRLINIKDIFPKFSPQKNKQYAAVKGEPYILTSAKNGNFTEVYFDKDISPENTASNVAVGLIFIDNLSEALETTEEKRRGVIKVIIDNKITNYFQKEGGIVRRFENDKYIFVLCSSLLDKCRENKFSVLESIKQIDCGGSGSITISIGVGINGKTLKASLDYAKTAIELCLSRGGDQAIIKKDENYEFFGGKVNSVTGNSRVRARAKAYALQDLISECSNVLVMGHKNADFDSLGACVGISKIAYSFDRPFNIVLGNVSSSVMPLYNRLKDDKIYKDKFVQPNEAEKLLKSGTLLIVADCHIASCCENPALLELAKKYVVFDHHRKVPNSISGYVLSYLEPRASSASELVCEMLKYINTKFRLSPVEADALLSGIMLDTKYFTVKTGVQTFDSASYLKNQGADTIRVKKMFKENIKTYFDRIEAIRGCKIINGNLAIATCPDMCENPLLTAATTADELLKISGIEASFVIAKCNSCVNISMRSLGYINTARIAEKLGGGGHFETAACQLPLSDFDNAEKMLTEKIEEFLREE